ncbi:40S ribosomal protein S12 [Thelohanellus kitauei]|uniref:40S ribosomal protein S12 n=1 Tax=Thelohanellus kitauei TaxID=669202 RepID=A0A0C2MIG9_THEKT|nr:40S ribosomal protein S12 [Thelohanellus kitauei]
MEEGSDPSKDLLKRLIISARFFDALSMGINESVRSLETRDAQLCVLAGDCDEANYVALVNGLAKENSVPLYKFPHGQKKLGEMLGLCKMDREGKPRKVIRCSCFVVRNKASDASVADMIKSLVSS